LNLYLLYILTDQRKLFIDFIFPTLKKNKCKLSLWSILKNLEHKIKETTDLALEIKRVYLEKKSKFINSFYEDKDAKGLFCTQFANYSDIKKRFELKKKSVVASTRLQLHPHCLNPVAFRRIISTINSNFGLSIIDQSTLKIHSIISKTVFLQLKELLVKIRHLSDHRIRTVKENLSTTLKINCNLLMKIRDKIETENNITDRKKIIKYNYSNSSEVLLNLANYHEIQ